jgi:hypothetical protein
MATPNNLAHLRSEEPPTPRQDCEQLAQLLRYAFPLSESGSFSGLLDSIRGDQPTLRR